MGSDNRRIAVCWMLLGYLSVWRFYKVGTFPRQLCCHIIEPIYLLAEPSRIGAVSISRPHNYPNIFAAGAPAAPGGVRNIRRYRPKNPPVSTCARLRFTCDRKRALAFLIEMHF